MNKLHGLQSLQNAHARFVEVADRMQAQADARLRAIAGLFYKEDVDPKTGKLSDEHLENCTGCALCEE